MERSGLIVSTDFGWPKQGQKFVVPPFHIDFLNPECVRIPWLLSPKKIPVDNFGDGVIYKKVPVFTNFSCRPQQTLAACCGLNFDAISTFQIATLSRYTPKFSGVA